MSVHRPMPGSRRAFLFAAAGTATAVIAAALGRPPEARAADGDALLLGIPNSASTTTELDLPSTLPTLPSGPALRVTSSGDGLGVAIEAHSTEDWAIVADSVWGGVKGTSPNGSGILGVSTVNYGVQGYSESGDGVFGGSPTGTAGHFASEHGSALVVAGLARFSRSGRASVLAGHSSVDIDLRALGGLSGTPLCFANLMTFRPGIAVTTVRPNYPVKGKARIYLNRAVDGKTFVAWLVMNAPVPPAVPDPNGP